MARRTFFSFHYQRDIWRVNQIRSAPNITGCAAAGFQDASLWEEAKRKGDAAIKALIDNGLLNTTVTVVCIGAQSASRKYINYEIEKSRDRGNGLMGIRIHHLKGANQLTDAPGVIPSLLSQYKAPIYTYTNLTDLAGWIESVARAAGR